MNTKQLSPPKLFNQKLFNQKLFSSLLRGYNVEDITGEGFCEIVNNKADKIISLNSELLEALDICYKSLCTYGEHPIIENQVNKVFEKANKINNELR